MSGSATAQVGKPPTIGPRSGPSPDVAAVFALARLEGEVRAAGALSDLVLLIANETRKLIRAQQIIVFKPGLRGRLVAEGATGAGAVDLGSPLMQAFDSLVRAIEIEGVLGKTREFQLRREVAGTGDALAHYPFKEALWVPFVARNKTVLGGMLLLRGEPWKDADIALSQRLAGTYAQAWYWLSTSYAPWAMSDWDRRKVLYLGWISLLIAVFPVRLTSLAPMEVVAKGATVIAAPLDAVIESIPVISGQTVSTGDVLIKFSDTTLRNRLDVVAREAQVAFSRVKKTTLLAVSDIRGRQELALARAEYAVKLAEHTYARDMLERTVVRATQDGIVIFGDKRDLIGRPAVTGERLMEFGDPTRVEIRIDVPVADSIILGKDRRAKLFLDARPLSAEDVVVTTSDYQARANETGQLTYRVIAEWPEGRSSPRLGTRGTAQLYGQRSPLIWSLLRRPFSALRQWSGL